MMKRVIASTEPSVLMDHARTLFNMYSQLEIERRMAANPKKKDLIDEALGHLDKVIWLVRDASRINDEE